MHFHILAPSNLGIFTPPFQGKRTVPIRASRALAQSGARAILDGPMFVFCGSLPREACVESQFLLYDQKRNLLIPSSRPTDGMTISVLSGRAVVTSGAQIPVGSQVSVQLYPELIRNGRVVASRTRDTSNVWRAALGILPNGSLVFAVDQGTMFDFASRLRNFGVIEAGYTDGSGSAELMTPTWRAGDPEDRPKGAWLMDLPQAPPSQQDSTFLFLLGLGALAYWVSRS